ncbi:MAG: hypothetical protein ACD_72C00497G0001 [uncultured bacterium]|nr:MAG: hypothetical protein ACD_72C00497G0001 [uncultured bacterium]
MNFLWKEGVVSMEEMANRIATSSGVIGVDGKRVVYHALNYKRDRSVSDPILIKEMILEGGVLYVASTIVGVEMDVAQQREGVAKMVNFVRSSL